MANSFGQPQHDQHRHASLRRMRDKVSRLLLAREQRQRQEGADDPHAQAAEQPAQHQVPLQHLKQPLQASE